jgi:hypothetical protein
MQFLFIPISGWLFIGVLLSLNFALRLFSNRRQTDEEELTESY